MNTIRRIPDTSYYRVSTKDSDEWIMQPDTSRGYISAYGISPAGTAWFCSKSGDILFYSAETRAFLSRLKPEAIPDPKPGFANRTEYRALASQDGFHVYLFRSNGIYSRDLTIISIEQSRIVRTIKELPGGGGLVTYPPVFDQKGRILVSSSIRTEAVKGPGLIRIRPCTGEYETSVCAGSYASGWLFSPCPGGRYWLRFDNTQLPIKITNKPRLGVFGRRPSASEEFFGLGLEIWEAFPLRLVRTVVSLWLTADELPDEGHMDSGRTFDRDTGRMVGEGPKRREVYRRISQMLARDEKTNMLDLIQEPFRNEWPGEEFFRRHVSRNNSKLDLRTNVMGWQKDGEAVWLMRSGFVTCVGMDGTVSSRIMCKRYGYRFATRSPLAEGPRWVTPTTNRHADMEFPDGFVTVSGHADAEPHTIRVISEAEDQWRPREPDEQAKMDAKLVKKAAAMACKKRTYKLTLASLSEDNCVEAISDLANEIGPDLPERVFENRLEAVFVCEGKRLNEQKFFSLVANTCPSAVKPLRFLIDAYCDHVKPHTTAYWNPDKGIGAFAHAAHCLAILDPGSSSLLRRYGELIDTYHEYFFVGKTLPVMLKNLGSTVERLDLAEWVLLEKLGNCSSAGNFWKKTKMAKIARSLFSAEEYAERLLDKIQSGPDQMCKGIKFGHPVLVSLHHELNSDMSKWEADVFRSLAAAVALLEEN